MSDQPKCSRSSKHEVNGETESQDKGERIIPDKKTADTSDTGSIRSGSVNGQQGHEDRNSISGSRQSLRSASGDSARVTDGTNNHDDDTISRTSVNLSSHDGDESRSSSRASSAKQQRPKTSMRARSARHSSASSRRTSPDASSLTSRRSYDNDDFEVASFTEDTSADFSQYVDVVRQESSRLSLHEDLDPAPLDVSLLHSVLGDLTLSLKDSEARSLRIYEEIEEVREATIELKRTLIFRMGKTEEEQTEEQNGE